MNSRQEMYYPDIAIFLIAIPCISAFNYYLTYVNIKLDGFLLLTFTIDTVQGYMAWWTVRQFIFFLDRRLGYTRKRIALQFISTTFIGLAVIAILTEITSLIAKGRFAPLSFYTVDLVIISIWFFVINGIYIGLYFFNKTRVYELERQREEKMQRDGLIVRQGKLDLRLTFADIIGFFVDGEYVAACTSTKKFLLDLSLDQLESQVPSKFFRINRQYLVAHEMISGFKRIENGKLAVSLKPSDHFPPEVTVSRIKAAQFKDWFTSSAVIPG